MSIQSQNPSAEGCGHRFSLTDLRANDDGLGGGKGRFASYTEHLMACIEARDKSQEFFKLAQPGIPLRDA